MKPRAQNDAERYGPNGVRFRITDAACADIAVRQREQFGGPVTCGTRAAKLPDIVPAGREVIGA